MIKVVIILAILYIIFQTAYSGFYFLKSHVLAKKVYLGQFYLGNKTNPEYKIWIDGDSVGAGVGASSFETSLSGRIGEFEAKNKHVALFNNSISGSRMADLVNKNAPKDKQDLIVLIISSNDLFHFTNLSDFKTSTVAVLKKYATLTDKLILIGPGRIFDADAIPLIAKPAYRYFAKSYAKVLSEETAKYKNVAYVNPTNTSADPTKYGDTGASDRFHPNDEGYRFWFDLLEPRLR